MKQHIIDILAFFHEFNEKFNNPLCLFQDFCLARYLLSGSTAQSSKQSSQGLTVNSAT